MHEFSLTIINVICMSHSGIDDEVTNRKIKETKQPSVQLRNSTKETKTQPPLAKLSSPLMCTSRHRHHIFSPVPATPCTPKPPDMWVAVLRCYNCWGEVYTYVYHVSCLYNEINLSRSIWIYIVTILLESLNRPRIYACRKR